MTSILNPMNSTSRKEISAKSTLPLYTQIKEALRAKILDGSYVAHERLPSESEMMSAFSVSRITVRQAISDLQKEGLLFKIHGKGTFVAMPKVAQELTRLQGFGEAMNRLGHETFSQVIRFESVHADSLICSKLGLKEGSEVCELQRVRYLNREPISVDYSYLPQKIGSQLLRANLQERDLFSLLENELDQKLQSADLEIDATSAGTEIAHHLKVFANSPILRIERLTYAKQSKPLVFEYLHYRPEMFKYKLSITRD